MIIKFSILNFQTNMEEEISINGNTRLQPTHSFVYEGKKFPFNMKLFKCFSQYFHANKNRFKNITDINIFDDSDEIFDLTESTINDFINFCQSKIITLNKENAPCLHKLAKKYDVPLLIDSTNEFIQIHQKEVVVDLLVLNLNNGHFDTAEYEELISNDLPYYVNDDKLLLLPIPVLNQIITKYHQKNLEQSNNDQICTQITSFLFKCLDKYGIEASVLFSQIDLSRSKNNALNRLLYEYSGKFDFHFINSQILKTVYELENKLIERAEKMTNVKKIEDMIQKQEERDKMKDDQIQQKNDEIDRLVRQQEERNKENDKKIQSLIQQHEEKVRQIQSDFKSQLDNLNEKVRQLTEKLKENSGFIDQLKQKQKQEEEMKRQTPLFSYRFNGESNPSGIISNLGDSVTLSCGANDDSSHPITNIKKFDTSYFINNNYSHPNLESDTYITFDFGTSRKIDLYSYFIHSANYHPKTWRIDGSNDNLNWTPIDRRTNVQNLYNGNHKSHFECQEAKHQNENFKFRYIRYSQQDSWTNGDPYRVYFYYFELYGDVFSC